MKKTTWLFVLSFFLCNFPEAAPPASSTPKLPQEFLEISGWRLRAKSRESGRELPQWKLAPKFPLEIYNAQSLSSPHQDYRESLNAFLNDPSYGCLYPKKFRFFQKQLGNPNKEPNCDYSQEELAYLHEDTHFYLGVVSPQKESLNGAAFGHIYLSIKNTTLNLDNTIQFAANVMTLVPDPELAEKLSRETSLGAAKNLGYLTQIRNSIYHMVNRVSPMEGGLEYLWKGLSGGFNLQMLEVPLVDYRQRYIGQNRSLSATQVLLSAEAKGDFAKTLIWAKRHFNRLSGDRSLGYYFLTDNCSTIVRDLILGVLGHDARFNGRPLKPYVMAGWMYKQGLVKDYLSVPKGDEQLSLIQAKSNIDTSKVPDTETLIEAVRSFQRQEMSREDLETLVALAQRGSRNAVTLYIAGLLRWQFMNPHFSLDFIAAPDRAKRSLALRNILKSQDLSPEAKKNFVRRYVNSSHLARTQLFEPATLIKADLLWIYSMENIDFPLQEWGNQFFQGLLNGKQEDVVTVCRFTDSVPLFRFRCLSYELLKNLEFLEGVENAQGLEPVLRAWIANQPYKGSIPSFENTDLNEFLKYATQLRPYIQYREGFLGQ